MEIKLFLENFYHAVSLKEWRSLKLASQKPFKIAIFICVFTWQRSTYSSFQKIFRKSSYVRRTTEETLTGLCDGFFHCAPKIIFLHHRRTTEETLMRVPSVVRRWWCMRVSSVVRRRWCWLIWGREGFLRGAPNSWVFSYATKGGLKSSQNSIMCPKCKYSS